jgi:pimeloyl-ACP methyl ester carboxylesterase
LILGEKDPVLNYEENRDQIENTNVVLVTLPDGHMSHIENQSEVLKVIGEFVKKT